MRGAVQHLGDVTCEIGVPGVAVHQIRALASGRHLQVDTENLERGVGRFQPAGHPVGLDAMLGS
jgi:hypothetical protein